MRTLVIETATAACSVALFEHDAVVAAHHDLVGRGHAEQLIPMIAALPGGGRAGHILVDVGPGSFTGIRVGIAAARGLALGWGSAVAGFSTLALLARQALDRDGGDAVAVVTEGGHGEVFMQRFAASPFAVRDTLASRTPSAALAALAGQHPVGSGVRWLAALDPSLTPDPLLPNAAAALTLPVAMRSLPPRPLYGRAPDAKLPA